jgi:hypothetical protein
MIRVLVGVAIAVGLFGCGKDPCGSQQCGASCELESRPVAGPIGYVERKIPGTCNSSGTCVIGTTDVERQDN